jgi:hypothetical protein
MAQALDQSSALGSFAALRMTCMADQFLILFQHQIFGLAFALAASLEEDLDAAFGGFELLFAGVGELDALLEEGERFVEWEIALFEAIDDGFERFELFFEGCHVPAYSASLQPADT